MIKISEAKDQEDLYEEWRKFTKLQYGEDAVWTEKKYKFKAVENDKIIGTIAGKYEPGVIYIAELMITESEREKGVGTMLINKAEEYGKSLGAHRSWLMTGSDWSNRDFYNKLGFEVIATLPDFYFHKDLVIYTRLIK